MRLALRTQGNEPGRVRGAGRGTSAALTNVSPHGVGSGCTEGWPKAAAPSWQVPRTNPVSALAENQGY